MATRFPFWTDRNAPTNRHLALAIAGENGALMHKPAFDTLDRFLSNVIDEGFTHFRLIAKKDPEGVVSFYIHRHGDEDGSNGDLRTWEFEVVDNTLETRNIDFNDPTKYTHEGFDYHSGTTRKVEQQERIMSDNIRALWTKMGKDVDVNDLSRQELEEIALEAFNLASAIQVRDIVAP